MESLWQRAEWASLSGSDIENKYLNMEIVSHNRIVDKHTIQVGCLIYPECSRLAVKSVQICFYERRIEAFLNQGSLRQIITTSLEIDIL